MLRHQPQPPPPPPPPLLELVAFRAPGPPSCKGLADPAPGPCPPAAASASAALRSEQQQLRRKINSRERKRMQDLNLAMDALREVILPYSAAHCQSSPPGRKLSKIATLLLARNYILLLGSSLQELRRALAEVSAAAPPGAAGPRLLLAPGFPLFAPGAPVLLAGPGSAGPQLPQLPQPPQGGAPPTGSASASSGKYLALRAGLEEPPPPPCSLAPGPGLLCPCALGKLPPLLPPGLGLAALQAHFGK